MRLASAYMAWRHVQKLSRAVRRNSVLPAMARWKAWLWPFGMPGMTMPAILSAAAAAAVPPAPPAPPAAASPSAAVSMAVMKPLSATLTWTPRTQP
jgi:hypothetical protein